MKRLTLAILLALATPTFATPALANSESSTAQTPSNRYDRTTLANGLSVHFLTVPIEKGRLDVRLQVGVGASDENGVDEIGTAHMVEHMVFRRADGYPDGVGDFLIKNGFVRGANFNAMTNFERTLYMFSPHKGVRELDTTLSALSAMMSHRPFTLDDWQKEQQVILHEWRDGQGVNERINRQRTNAIRMGSRQARHPIIGTKNSIEHTPLTTLQNFFEKWYVANNMTLIVSGDLDFFDVNQDGQHDELLLKIKPLFEKLPQAPLPDRTGNYYEPTLQNAWHTAILGDKDSGTSQLAMIFRLDDSKSRDYATLDGTRQRIIERFASFVLGERLKALDDLPSDVKNVGFRKADIGRHTLAVGLFASVTPTGHQTAVQYLTTVRARLLQSDVQADEFLAYQDKLTASIAQAETKTTLTGGFGDVLMSVSDAVFNDKPVRTPADNAKLVKAVLPQITPYDISLKIHEWLTAQDVLIQAQAPSNGKVTLAPTKTLQTLATQTLATPQSPLYAKLGTPSPSQKTATANLADDFFYTPSTTGTITKQTRQPINNPKTQTTHHSTTLHLSNGDRVFVLTHPIAGDKTYLHAIAKPSPNDTPLWQLGLASQLIWQSGVAGFDKSIINAHQKTHGLTLSYRLDPHAQKTDLHSDNQHLERLLALFNARHTAPQIDDDWQLATASLKRSLTMANSTNTQKQLAQATLRYGSPTPAPSLDELNALDKTTLLTNWQTLSYTPTDYYVLSKLSADDLSPLFEKYLASLTKTQTPPFAKPAPPLLGKAQHTHHLLDNKAEVALFAVTPVPYTPSLAMQVSLLQGLANQRLKAVLRDELLGTYSIKFDSTAEQTGITSQVKFSTDDTTAQSLADTAHQVLLNFWQTLDAQQVARLKQQFIKDETARLQNPATWLNRYALSHQVYGDARYVQTMHDLADDITLDNLQNTARLMWQDDNVRTLILLSNAKP